MAKAWQIGTTQGTMVTLASLGIPNPEHPYQEYAQLIRLGDGNSRGFGYGSVIWRWAGAGFGTDQWDALRTYCAGVSAEVYIETPVNENDEENRQFRAIMTWPLEPRRDAGRWINFQIEFTILEDVTPPAP